MSVVKRTCSFDEDAWAYAQQRAKRLKKSVSAVVSEVLLEQRRFDARTRVLEEYGTDADVSDEALEKVARKLGR
jgi:hypothetical protein